MTTGRPAASSAAGATASNSERPADTGDPVAAQPGQRDEHRDMHECENRERDGDGALQACEVVDRRDHARLPVKQAASARGSRIRTAPRACRAGGEIRTVRLDDDDERQCALPDDAGPGIARALHRVAGIDPRREQHRDDPAVVWRLRFATAPV